MVTDYVPDQGDLVWLTLTPQAGHEQAGRRPVLVLSPQKYNARTSLALVCPVTSQVKGYPFEVALPMELPIQGVILADQIRSLDWRIRQAEFIGVAPEEMVDQVHVKIKVLLGL